MTEEKKGNKKAKKKGGDQCYGNAHEELKRRLKALKIVPVL